MQVLEKTFSKNNNEITLIGADTTPKRPILVVGVFHGDEPQGKFLIENYLKSNDCGNLLFIPCLNPDGLLLNSRENANGVDLNRNFDDKTEIETKFLIKIMEKYTPQAVLTLHAPFCVVNYDGPAEDLAKAISDIISYPVQADIGYPTPGSFGTWAGVERNLPIITLELDEKIEVDDLITPINNIFEYLKLLFRIK